MITRLARAFKEDQEARGDQNDGMKIIVLVKQTNVITGDKPMHLKSAKDG